MGYFAGLATTPCEDRMKAQGKLFLVFLVKSVRVGNTEERYYQIVSNNHTFLKAAHKARLYHCINVKYMTRKNCRRALLEINKYLPAGAKMGTKTPKWKRWLSMDTLKKWWHSFAIGLSLPIPRTA